MELDLAPTRSKAQQMIQAGEVEVFTGDQWKCMLKPSFPSATLTSESIRIKSNSTVLKFVSRGGLKLESALEHLKLNVSGWRCLDIGLSTGGFSDCLLQKGAKEILGVDVGHGQLHPRLMSDQRLRALSGINARELEKNPEVMTWIQGGIDLCLIDVSFISLHKVIPSVAQVLPVGSRLLALVKPQFEVGPENLDRHGIVRNTDLFAGVISQMLHGLQNCGFSTITSWASAVKGTDGNCEFFVYALRS